MLLIRAGVRYGTSEPYFIAALYTLTLHNTLLARLPTQSSRVSSLDKQIGNSGDFEPRSGVGLQKISFGIVVPAATSCSFRNQDVYDNDDDDDDNNSN